MNRSRHLPGRHVRRLTRVFRRQLVVERDDDGLFAREIAIEQADADARFFRDIAKGGRFVAARGDQPHRRGVQALPRGGTLRRRPGGRPRFRGLTFLVNMFINIRAWLCSPAQAPANIAGAHLVLYDGVCGLCNRLLQFLLKHDHRAVFSFRVAAECDRKSDGGALGR